MKFVNESISDILKPKEFRGKLLYVSSSITDLPAFVIKMIDFYSEINYFLVEVVYNSFMISGPLLFELNEGETTEINKDDIDNYELKELNKEALSEFEQRINDKVNTLILLKKHLHDLI